MKFISVVISGLICNLCCWAQSYKHTCDSISVCWGGDEFSKEFNGLYNSIKSDSIVSYTLYGGIGCHTIKAFICYVENGKYIIHYYNNHKILLNAKLKNKDARLIHKFFQEKLYSVNDSIVTQQIFVSDGASHKIVYRVGNYCASYTFMPDFYEGKLQDWIIELRKIPYDRYENYK